MGGECVSPTDVSASGGSSGSGGSGDSNQSGGRPITATHDAGIGASAGRGTAGTQGEGGALIFETGGTAGKGTGGRQAVCSGRASEVDPAPVDAYLMFDQSSSMADPIPNANPPTTWWHAAQLAVTSFVNDPRVAGSLPGRPAMSVGIQFFPLNGIAPQSCMANYQTPEVEIGLLGGNAGAIGTAIQMHQPTAFTPTAPALSGAVAHMKEWASNHAGHVPVVVFVTDGYPTECDPMDITDVAQIAATAFNSEPKVRTFVVGFNLGPGGANLDQIAAAGGTNKAFLIDGGDIGAQFVDAMLGISNTPLECKFDLPVGPAGQSLDTSLLAVTYTPTTTMVETQIPKLNGLGDCALNAGNGWYFDSPTKPTKIEVCPGTCSKFSAGIVKTVVGCTSTPGNTH
jgi:hypothetical protein